MVAFYSSLLERGKHAHLAVSAHPRSLLECRGSLIHGLGGAVPSFELLPTKTCDMRGTTKPIKAVYARRTAEYMHEAADRESQLPTIVGAWSAILHVMLYLFCVLELGSSRSVQQYTYCIQRALSWCLW